jgi:hypothetical protein
MTRREQRANARAIARLRRWYAWSTGGRWSVRELIQAWTLRMSPNVWNLGWPPTDTEIAGHPGRYLIHAFAEHHLPVVPWRHDDLLREINS